MRVSRIKFKLLARIRVINSSTIPAKNYILVCDTLIELSFFLSVRIPLEIKQIVNDIIVEI